MMTEGPNVPTYRLREPVKAQVEVGVPPGTTKVIAFFMHEGDPYAHGAMVGHVDEGASGIVTVLLQGSATIINEAYGDYLCHSLHAEDADGKRISFLSVPEVRYRVVRDSAPTSEVAQDAYPALVSWTWV